MIRVDLSGFGCNLQWLPNSFWCQPKIRAKKRGAPTSQPAKVLPLNSAMPAPMMVDSKRAMPGHIPSPPQPLVEQLSFSVFIGI